MKHIYERVTKQITGNLGKAGSWQKLWKTTPAINLKGQMYFGINQLLLSSMDHPSSVWGTFNQIRSNGGSVNKGEKSCAVVFWKRLLNVDVNADGKPYEDVSYFLRYYNVFNADQCTFDKTGQTKVEKLAGMSEAHALKRSKTADMIVSQMPSKPHIVHCQTNPKYLINSDTIKLPPLSSFQTSEAYYNSLLHELVHSTGHSSRLNRFKENHREDIGDYSREELVAELGSAYLCTISGLDHVTDSSTAYIKSWLQALENNPSWITWAASRAEKACNLILNDKSIDEQSVAA